LSLAGEAVPGGQCAGVVGAEDACSGFENGLVFGAGCGVVAACGDLVSGLMYPVDFSSIPAYATSTLPGHPLPHWWVTVAAALVGLGVHFANALPDLAGDRIAEVRGLAQQVASRWGSGAVRAAAAVALAVVSARGRGKVRSWPRSVSRRSTCCCSWPA
jgi:4-hydroxybenzoate polyprenyltransferase